MRSPARLISAICLLFVNDAWPDSNLVVNPGFEAGSRVIGPRPTTFAQWQGDRVVYTPAENGIVPFEGLRMLRFINGEFVASSSGASEYWQNIDLSAFKADVDAGIVQATASAYFNRVPGDAQTDTAMGVSFRMYSGTPTNRVVLGEIFGGIVSDGDPSTWQRAQVESYRLLPGTDFLMLKISANENVFNDEVNPEFDGHYADNVQLTLKVSPHVNVRLEDFQASGVLGYQHLGSETTYGSSGVFRLQTEDPAGTLASLVGSTAFAFCIELSQSYTSSLENYFVGDLTTANSPLGPNGPITQAQQDLVAQLWARHFDPTWKASGPYSPEDVTRSMAFHASILEILADFDGFSLGSIDLDAGDFKLINGYLLDVNDPSQELQVRMVANSFLSSLTTSYSGRLPRLLALTNDQFQDYLVEAVPESHSVALTLFGLLTLAFLRSRMRQHAKADQ